MNHLLKKIVMKKLVLILVLILTLQQSFSYTWENYSPPGIKANNLCLFWSDYGCALICTDSGMYLNTNSWMPMWEYFNYPVKDAQLLNNDTLLVIANEGSYSDGIYSFNLQTYEYTNIDFWYRPNFIEYYETEGVFYVGFETGLVKSEDGLNWTEIPYFAGMNCVDLEFYYDHIIVNVLADLTHLFLSDNSGINWFEASTSPGWITDMTFNWQGELYGIFPDNSWSSGLWYSNDYGDNWEVEFYSVYMTALEFHNEEKLFVGWHSPVKDYEGIALYNLQNQEFTYLNEGLLNTNGIVTIYRINYLNIGKYNCILTYLWFCSINISFTFPATNTRIIIVVCIKRIFIIFCTCQAKYITDRTIFVEHDAEKIIIIKNIAFKN